MLLIYSIPVYIIVTTGAQYSDVQMFRLRS